MLSRNELPIKVIEGSCGVARRGQQGSSTAQPLGNATKSHGRGRKGDKVASFRAARAARWSLQRAAGRLLPDHRVSGCMSRCGSGGVEVVVNSEGNASYKGLQVCGSVWACPVCSGLISNTRRKELNTLLAWARGKAYHPVLVSFTLQHSRDDQLRAVLDRLVKAKTKLHQSRSWVSQKCSIVGQVSCLEVTHGQNGWHPHYHVLVIVKARSARVAIGIVRAAAAGWDRAVNLAGGYCNEHGSQVQGALNAKDYITKWGAAEEMTFTQAKNQKGRDGGRSPWQLLRSYDGGDLQAGALFAEYVEVFAGRRQLVWSRGLRDLVGLEEKTDEEICNEGGADQNVRGLVALTKPMWLEIVRREERTFVLDVYETGGYHALANYLSRIEVTLRKSQFGVQLPLWYSLL